MVDGKKFSQARTSPPTVLLSFFYDRAIGQDYAAGASDGSKAPLLLRDTWIPKVGKGVSASTSSKNC